MTMVLTRIYIIIIAMVYFLRPKSMERLYNILLLIGFCFGGANLLFFYQMEFAARIYCPRQVCMHIAEL